MASAVPIDIYAAPTTQIFAAIGLIWLTLKIFSFWRLIASLLILPGTSVNLTHPLLTDRSADLG